MITSPLKTFKSLLNCLNAKHAIVLSSYMSLSVTHVRRNILERQGQEKLIEEAEWECIANAFGNHNTNN